MPNMSAMVGPGNMFGWDSYIAGLVHVNDLDLTTQILVSPCHTCSVYAITLQEMFHLHSGVNGHTFLGVPI